MMVYEESELTEALATYQQVRKAIRDIKRRVAAIFSQRSVRQSSSLVEALLAQEREEDLELVFRCLAKAPEYMWMSSN